jgi:hypothetical protein
MATLHFEVDAALLQELGERLIGQPYIALAELVKNAYDADARVCDIRFEEDAIEVTDDGHGMTPGEFKNRWMRIASPHKQRDVTSRELGRPLTGSKGIGRLSVQFLAERLILQSSAKKSGRLVTASADWREIHPGENLSTVRVKYEETPRPRDHTFARDRPHGVRIRLEGLRDKWPPDDLRKLGRQLWMLQPPFRRMMDGSNRTGFEVEVSSADPIQQEAFEDATSAALDRNWQARITGRIARKGHAAKTFVRIEFREGHGGPESESHEVALPFPLPHKSDEDSIGPELEVRDPYVDQARFDIRVYRRLGRQSAGVRLNELKEYLDEFGGVSVFDTGFRLPYYAPATAKLDWCCSR